MLAIINAHIETISNGALKDGLILIDKGKIIAIGLNFKVPSYAKIIDAKGRRVTPGIIDAHTHVGIMEHGIGLPGIDIVEITNPITPWCNAIDGINMLDKAFEMYRRAGITSTNVLPGGYNIFSGTSVALKCRGNIIEDAIIKKSTGMKVALGENPKEVYGNKKMSPTTRMGIASLMRETFFKAKEYLRNIEIASSDEERRCRRRHQIRNRRILERPDFDKTSEALIPVLKKDIPLRIHCHRSDDIVTAIRLAKEFDLKYVLEHVTDGHLLVDFIAQENISCAIGPTMNSPSKVETKNKDFRTSVLFSRKGIPFALMTDHPITAGRYLTLVAGLAVSWGMEREIALRSITLSAAEHIGIEDRVGSLEVGKDADLVLWSGDPLDFTTFADLTIIDGQIVYNREVE